MPKKNIKKVKVVRTADGIKRIPVKNPEPKRVSEAAQAKQAANPKLVTIEDSVIRGILADPRYEKVIPCLASGKQALQSVGKKCGRCSRKRKMYRNQAMQQIKGCIAGLKGQEAKQFKKLLGAENVRVYKPTRKGQQPVPITF